MIEDDTSDVQTLFTWGPLSLAKTDGTLCRKNINFKVAIAEVLLKHCTSIYAT